MSAKFRRAGRVVSGMTVFGTVSGIGNASWLCQ
ncbi:hypothetical protein EMIT0111MI5_10760 [Burkholderia sp. IT-111MI5]